MAKPNHKAVELDGANEVPTVEEQEYFFPDIDGKQITVKAKTREEAEAKAKAEINK
jgi:hypothetical protein